MTAGPQFTGRPAGVASLGPAMQIGYLVPDLDAAVQHWITGAGVGPWTIYRNVALNGAYRGETTAVRIHVALSFQGDQQVELIQLLSDTPSPYADNAGRPLAGIHHIAWLTEDLDATLAEADARGLSLAFQAGGPGTRVVYMESPSQPGQLFEFIENPEMASGLPAGIAAARDWDGRDPIAAEIDFAAAAPA